MRRRRFRRRHPASRSGEMAGRHRGRGGADVVVRMALSHQPASLAPTPKLDRRSTAARGRMVPLVLRRTLLDGADGQPRLALHDMPSATDAVEVSP